MAVETPSVPFLKRRSTWLAGSILLILGLASPFAYKQLKVWRADYLVGKVGEYAADERWMDALQNVSAAYQLAPHSPKVLRAMADLYGKLNVERALEVWKELLSLPEVSSQDRRDFVSYALLVRRPGLALPQIEILLKEDPYLPANVLLQAEYLASVGQMQKAVDILEVMTTAHPEERKARLMLAVLLISTRSAENLQKAKSELMLLGEGQDEQSMEALRLLIRLPDLEGASYQAARDRLLKHPLKPEENRLVVDEMDMRREPARRQAILEDVVQDARGRELEGRLLPARWLNVQRASDRVLEVFNKDEAVQRRDAFLIWADAMALQNRWQELDEIFSKENLPLDREVVALFRARIAKELGEDKRAELLWNRAVKDAANRSEVLWFMGGYAEKLRQYEMAQEAYRELARKADSNMEAYHALIRLQEKEGDTRGLRDLLVEMDARYPGRDDIRNDITYLNLLLAENVSQSIDDAISLVNAHPEIMAYRVTAALALVRKGDAAAANQILAAARLNGEQWSQMLPGWQAVYAVSLALDGDGDGARSIAAAIPTGRLKPEEAALLIAVPR